MLILIFKLLVECGRLKLVAEAMENFNAAQEEYGPCKIMVFADSTQGLNDLTLDFPEAVMSRLYVTIAETLNQDTPELYVALLGAVVEQLKTVDFKEKIMGAGKFLP